MFVRTDGLGRVPRCLDLIFVLLKFILNEGTVKTQLHTRQITNGGATCTLTNGHRENI